MPVPDAYLPTSFDAAKLRVGARTLDPAQWVSVRDDDWERTIAMKRVIVAERPHEVVACIEGAEEACDEVAAGVLRSIGAPPSIESGIDALVDAALHVADDLCILLPGADGVPHLSAAVLCAPNRWRLADKLGRGLAAIHDPVARYDTDLRSPVDAVIARLHPDRPLWRTNWGVSNHPALFQPDAPPVTPGIEPSDLWFRVEWQTLRRLPITGAVLFTIRTWVERMSDFATRDPAVLDDVADLILKLEENVAQYKSIAPYRERLYEFLGAR